MSRYLRILLADDDIAVRDATGAWLSELGHEVRTAAGGWPLVNGCQESLPDLVISEVRLPDLDGISAVRMILRDGPVPVILMSAAWDAALLGRAAVLGVPCLVKPLTPLALVTAVETACRDILAVTDGLELPDAAGNA